MHTFSLDTYYDASQRVRREAARRPRIGLTGNFADGETRLAKAYYHQVEQAGGTPVVLPPTADAAVIRSMLDTIDGLVLTGGADINPLWQGESPSPALHAINSERDLAELLTIRLAYDRHLPMLGICRGMQALAMALGGKVTQDIYEADTKHERMKHSQDGPRNEPTHTVAVDSGSMLGRIYRNMSASEDDTGASQAITLHVNSMHHQAVGDPGEKFRAVAMAPDGIIEAMESSEHRAIVGVQWHPECLEEAGQPLFRWLIGEADTYRRARRLHRDIITLDTHCDTPMFFKDGVDFRHRDARIKVDYDKMLDGGLDAATMVAYIPQTMADNLLPAPFFPGPQPIMGSVPLTPFVYADRQLDRIEELVVQSDDTLAIARTPEELLRNKHEGKRSIMLAIENGLALEGNPANVAYFAERGIVYITLCHNGDNDLCDSAKGRNTHKGVSALGAEVIREMNRHGLMVDLSHAAERSFYDAIDISRTPIVCSHSNCRALCDHPRNLTDDQMRALRDSGGLMHITLYPGFLRQKGEASILDALAHLRHAIDIMGTEHVGIGTDFDGDGGVRGFNDASDAVGFTLHLLRKRYSDDDIRRIWGGNWTALMERIQSERE